MKKYIYGIAIVFLFLAISANIYAQGKSSKDNSDKDKKNKKEKELSIDSMMIDLQIVEEKMIQEMKEQSKGKQVKALHVFIFSSIKSEAGKIRNYFLKGIDTAGINQEVKSIEDKYLTAFDEILIKDNFRQTTRNLKTSEIIMYELLRALDISDKKTDEHLKNLNTFRNNLDSIANDSVLFIFPKDTAYLTEYFLNLADLSKEVVPIDTNLNIAIKNLNSIKSNINTLFSRIYSGLNTIKESRSDYEGIIFTQELPFIWQSHDEYNSFKDAVSFSFKKNKLVLSTYVNIYIKHIYIAFILLLSVYFFIRKLRKKISDDSELQNDYYYKVLLKRPFLSSLFISLNIAQFIFPNPPVIFSGFIWFVSGVLLILLLFNNQRKYIIRHFIYIFIFFILIFQINLLLEISLFERWFMLILAGAALTYGVIVIKKHWNLISADFKLKIFSFFPLILIFASSVTNITGRFNLSKTLLISGVLIVFIAALLYFAMKLLEKLLMLITSDYENTTNEKFRQDLRKLNFTLPGILKVAAITGWIILMGRNFYFYDYVTSGIQYFLETEQTIGNFKFSFSVILLFLIIIVISAIISKIISIYSDSKSSKVNIDPIQGTKSSGLGNWLLLIRIAIVTAGVLAAFAATGIPIDKLTIILGSLGVGIGFGMQTIVNNLVSGILLAFERPVQIGDQIEVDGKSGIIREIGIRSSKIETFEGSDIIIPNGDLLSKSVINWTRNNNQRRIEITINIKNSNDIIKSKGILESILSNNDLVDKTPSPMVLLSKLSSISAEFRILLWTDIFKATELKSNILFDIQNELKKEGIELTT
jgi:small-conductance mechanosensitive channel